MTAAPALGNTDAIVQILSCEYLQYTHYNTFDIYLDVPDDSASFTLPDSLGCISLMTKLPDQISHVIVWSCNLFPA